MSKEIKLMPELRFPEFENEGEWENDELGNPLPIPAAKRNEEIRIAEKTAAQTTQENCGR